MKNWTFLIQKEGDRNWTSASPQMRLEEGKYRIVVHSQRLKENVEVRVTYQSQQNPAKRRSQKRSRQTNGEGLMVVIPFTQLKPGFWNIKCAGDATSNVSEEMWEESLQLQVLPLEKENLAVNPESQTPTPKSQLQNPKPQIPKSKTQNPKPQTPNSQPPTPTLQLTLNQTSFTTSRGEGVQIEGRIDNLSPTSNPHGIFQGILDYQLRNPQTGDSLFDVQKGLSNQTLPLEFSHTLKIPLNCPTHLLLGEVTIRSSSEESSEANPQEGRTRQSFTVTLNLGELFETIQPDAEPETPQPDAEPEKVALNLDLLKLANQPKKESQFQQKSASILPPKIAPSSPENNSRTPQLPTFSSPSPTDSEPEHPSNKSDSPTAESSPDPSTPTVEIEEEPQPLISPNKLEAIPSLTETLRQSEQDAEIEILEEVLGNDVQPNITSSPEDEDFQSLNTQDRFLSRLSTLATEEQYSAGVKSQEKEIFVFTPPLEEDSPPEIESEFPPDVENEDIEEDFPLLEEEEVETEVNDWQNNPELLVTDKSLKLEGESADLEKNLDLLMAAEKLLDIAKPTPSEEPQDNQPSIPSPGDKPSSTPPTIPNPLLSKPISPAVDWQTQEIVVDDDATEGQNQILSDTSGFPYPPELIHANTSSPEKTLSSSPRSLPTPTLILNEAELTAGTSVMIRVRLNAYDGSIYVKLWMQDLQTRMLIDGPYSLVNLIPNQQGDLETLTQINVPLGSLEVRFAAIAIDPDTKIESHKATLDRVVIPPDSPQISLEEFEI